MMLHRDMRASLGCRRAACARGGVYGLAVTLVLLAAACSGGGTGGGRGTGGPNGGGRPGETGRAPGEPVDPAAAVRLRHLDEPGLLVADTVTVTILPAALESDTEIEALHRETRTEGGHRVLIASGRVKASIRELRIETEELALHVLDEPIESLRVLAVGNARYQSKTAGSPEEPQATIILQPDRVLFGPE